LEVQEFVDEPRGIVEKCTREGGKFEGDEKFGAQRSQFPSDALLNSKKTNEMIHGILFCRNTVNQVDFTVSEYFSWGGSCSGEKGRSEDERGFYFASEAADLHALATMYFICLLISSV
jgi:hypothetical protein